MIKAVGASEVVALSGSVLEVCGGAAFSKAVGASEVVALSGNVVER